MSLHTCTKCRGLWSGPDDNLHSMHWRKAPCGHHALVNCVGEVVGATCHCFAAQPVTFPALLPAVLDPVRVSNPADHAVTAPPLVTLVANPTEGEITVASDATGPDINTWPLRGFQMDSPGPTPPWTISAPVPLPPTLSWVRRLNGRLFCERCDALGGEDLEAFEDQHLFCRGRGAGAVR